MLNILFYQISTQTLIFPLAAKTENIAVTISNCWNYCDFWNKNLQEESDKDLILSFNWNTWQSEYKFKKKKSSHVSEALMKWLHSFAYQLWYLCPFNMVLLISCLTFIKITVLAFHYYVYLHSQYPHCLYFTI